MVEENVDTTAPSPSTNDTKGDPAPARAEAQDTNATVNDTNGDHQTTDPTGPSSDPAPAQDDTDMKDAGEPADTAAAESSTAAAPANGTPASSKKASNGSAKKKSSAVPEHKSRKLNKKKSKPTLRLDAKPGNLYLARMKGHPPWPSIICDEEMLPFILLSSRPITTAQPDGTYKKPEYADGGKRVYERTFPIMFLETNEFAWISNTELTPITPQECTEITEKGKSRSLLEAYKTAAEGHDLPWFKDMLQQHQTALEEDAAERAEREAKKANKSKRKSMDATAAASKEDEADEMELDEEDGESKPKSKKRKKSLDSDGTEDKPAKTPKTGTKVKLSMPKTPAESASKKKAPKPKSSTKKSAAKAEASDDEVVDTPRVEEKPLTPAEAMERKEKLIRVYRHKLQKGFLSRDTVPSDEEIKSMSGFLSKLEEYPDLEGSIIRATKIHKVLKAMIRLASIPKDGEYEFKKRSHALLQKWNKILQDDPTAAADKEDDGKADGETSGESKDVRAQAEKAQAGEEAAPEEGKKEDLEKKIGTTVEGEKEAEGEDNAKAEGKAKAAENAETDEPNIETAPEEAYQPPSAPVEATA